MSFTHAPGFSARGRYDKTCRNALMSSSATQEPDNGAWEAIASVVLPWQPAIRPSSWDKKSLKPYQRFKKLFGERKFARNYPLKPFRLLDLPPEIRNQIYRHHLVLNHGVELAAKSTNFVDTYAVEKQQRRYAREIVPRLRLLRTNKQVNAETASIFYGDNEFRFSNVEGWYMLSAFLKTIGPANQARLRSIAVHTPWFGECTDSRYHRWPESDTRMHRLQGQMEDFGLRFRRPFRQFCYGSSVDHSIKVLETAGALKKFKIIVPDSYALTDELHYEGKGCMGVDHILDPAKFVHGLDVTLVRLHGGFSGRGQDQQSMDSSRLACVRSHVDAWDWAEIEWGWTVETVVHDRDGRYPVPLQAGDRIAELRRPPVPEETEE